MQALWPCWVSKSPIIASINPKPGLNKCAHTKAVSTSTVTAYKPKEVNSKKKKERRTLKKARKKRKETRTLG